MNDNFEEFGDFDFKPINKGLGFHKNSSEIKSTSVSNHEKSLNLKKQELKNKFNEDLLKRSSQLEEISLEKETSPRLSSKKKSIEASAIARSGSFIVDILFVSLVVASTFFFLFYFNKISFSTLGQTNIILLSSGLFIFYYLLYFSVFELMPWSSFGKLLFKLKVVSDGDFSLSFAESLFRSMLSLTLLPFLWTNLHNRLSRTKVTYY